MQNDVIIFSLPFSGEARICSVLKGFISSALTLLRIEITITKFGTCLSQDDRSAPVLLAFATVAFSGLPSSMSCPFPGCLQPTS